MYNDSPRPEQMDQMKQMRDAASALSTTLNMIVTDSDRMNPAEIRKLASFAKYEADRLLEALGPNAVGRRITLAERM